MNERPEDLLTIDEAAALLRVSPTTVRRWINSGELRAYRIGRRKICLRRRDVQETARPLTSIGAGSGRSYRSAPPPAGSAHLDSAELLADSRMARAYQLDRDRFLQALDIKPPSDEERTRGREALARAAQLREKLLAARGGVPFPDSTQDLYEIRMERSEELG